jgi:hypothetical protein
VSALRKILASVSFSCLVQLVAAPAGAAEPAKIEELIRQGVELRRVKENHRALPLFQQAYDLAPSPRTAAQLGLVEMALGYSLEAERHLSESLSATHDVWVKENRPVLEKSLARVKANIGEVVLDGGPSGAEVRVNGRIVGKLPLEVPVRLGEGPATVELRAAGYVTANRPLVVKAGERQLVRIDLDPEGRGSAPATLPVPSAVAVPLAGPATATRLDGEPADRTPADAPERPAVARPAAWVMAAAAAAALGFGVYETFVWRSQKNEFDNHTRPAADNPTMRVLDCGASDPGRGGPGCDAIYQRMQSAKTLMLVGAGIGAALAAGSAVLFVVSAQGEDTGTGHALACAPMGAMPGATCRITF